LSLGRPHADSGLIWPECPTHHPPAYVRKTSAYLTERESTPLAELARAEGRSQAEIIREAITAYVPPGRANGEFALAAGFERIDNDPRPISEIPEDELLDGFGW
jgi:predicted DNA-binding protein